MNSSEGPDSLKTTPATSQVQPLEGTRRYDFQNPEPPVEEFPGGRYRNLGEIARGGMGVILRVHDAQFDRTLAVKVLRPDCDRAAAERRFLAETRITGQLQHPGVPPAHEVGRLADGRP